MPRILIVGKTKMGQDGFCMGGLLLDSLRSVRLLPTSGKAHPMSIHKRYHVREIWDATIREVSPDQKLPPHSENVIFGGATFVERMAMADATKYLFENLHLPQVSPHGLFDGRIRYTRKNRGYVLRNALVPNYSTGFWRLNERLLLWHEFNHFGRKQPRYRTSDQSFDVKYVGFDKPISMLPAGSILRFSLTQGFDDDQRRRCYLQLSGWFLDDSLPAKKKAN